MRPVRGANDRRPRGFYPSLDMSISIRKETIRGKTDQPPLDPARDCTLPAPPSDFFLRKQTAGTPSKVDSLQQPSATQFRLINRFHVASPIPNRIIFLEPPTIIKHTSHYKFSSIYLRQLLAFVLFRSTTIPIPLQPLQSIMTRPSSCINRPDRSRPFPLPMLLFKPVPAVISTPCSCPTNHPFLLPYTYPYSHSCLLSNSIPRTMPL